MCSAFKLASALALPGIRVVGALALETKDGFNYPKEDVPVVLAGGTTRLMRWDLIPRGYLRDYNVTPDEASRTKNSQAKNPDTGKAWGFSSYNARIETVEKLWAFKDAWQDRQRGVIAIEAFRERPDKVDAPAEFKGREYEITLDRPYFLAALYDTWKSKGGETLESCTIITGPSDHIPAIQNIWHERTPILLSAEAVKIWLEPATTPKAAMALLREAPVPNMTVREVPKKEPIEKPAKAPKPKKEKKEKPKKDDGQIALDLFGG